MTRCLSCLATWTVTGDLDLVAGNLNQANRLYLNNGTADPWSGVTGSSVGDVYSTRSVVLGDVDGDGDGFYTGCDAYVTIPGPDCDCREPELRQRLHRRGQRRVLRGVRLRRHEAQLHHRLHGRGQRRLLRDERLRRDGVQLYV